MILREKPVHASSASHLDLIGFRAKTNAYHPSLPLRPPLPLFTVNQLTRRAGPVQAHYLFCLRYVSRHHPTIGSPWRKLPSHRYLFSLCYVSRPHPTVCSPWRKTTKPLLSVASPRVSRPHTTIYLCIVEKNYQAPTLCVFSACVQTRPDYLFTVEKITEFKGRRSVSLSCPVSVVSAHYLLFSVKCPDLVPSKHGA